MASGHASAFTATCLGIGERLNCHLVACPPSAVQQHHCNISVLSSSTSDIPINATVTIPTPTAPPPNPGPTCRWRLAWQLYSLVSGPAPSARSASPSTAAAKCACAPASTSCMLSLTPEMVPSAPLVTLRRESALNDLVSNHCLSLIMPKHAVGLGNTADILQPQPPYIVQQSK